MFGETKWQPEGEVEAAEVAAKMATNIKWQQLNIPQNVDVRPLPGFFSAALSWGKPEMLDFCLKRRMPIWGSPYVDRHSNMRLSLCYFFGGYLICSCLKQDNHNQNGWRSH